MRGAFGAVLIGGIGAAHAGAVAPDAPSVAQRLLQSHNIERQRVGVRPLVWSDRLAKDAAIWAHYLAATGRFEHAPNRPENDLEGENLWMGTVGAYTPEEMVGGWVDERADFVPGTFPRVTRTANWEDVGHYTQLIWHSTTQVGCAVAHNKSDDVLVCRYATPGNWMGENPLGK